MLVISLFTNINMSNFFNKSVFLQKKKSFYNTKMKKEYNKKMGFKITKTILTQTKLSKTTPKMNTLSKTTLMNYLIIIIINQFPQKTIIATKVHILNRNHPRILRNYCSLKKLRNYFRKFKTLLQTLKVKWPKICKLFCR